MIVTTIPIPPTTHTCCVDENLEMGSIKVPSIYNVQELKKAYCICNSVNHDSHIAFSNLNIIPMEDANAQYFIVSIDIARSIGLDYDIDIIAIFPTSVVKVKKYTLYDIDACKEQLITLHSERDQSPHKHNFLQEIGEAIGSNYAKFTASQYVCANGDGVEDDPYMFTINTDNGITEIWQLLGNATDMKGFTIPNTYRVKQIGIVFE